MNLSFEHSENIKKCNNRTMKKGFILLGALVVLFGVLFFIWARQKENSYNSGEIMHAPIVNELDQRIKSDEVFRNDLSKALANRPEDNYWYGKGIADLLTFFDTWLVSLPPPDPDQARYYDDIFGDFYSHNRIAVEPAKSLTRTEPFLGWLEKFVMARGTYMDSEDSASDLSAWLQSPTLHIDDYIVPPHGFASFNQFFTREIKLGARPISSPDNDSIVTSPADSEISTSTIPLTSETDLEVKGMALHVHELLGEDPIAEEFYGGVATSFGLGVTDYHHFHSPVSGKISKVKMIPNRYFGMSTFDEFFTENHRGYCIIETPKYGKVALVAIGITTISSVHFSSTAGKVIKKGEELGNFAYGGSEVLVLFQPGHFSISNFSKGEHVLMGQKVGILQ